MVGERGSSSSPSRLSPLAPPFTLNRSTRTPNSSLLPQSQQNSYASSLTPSLQNWHSSSSSPLPTSVLESFPTHTFEYDDSSIAAPLSAYGYLGHHSDSAFQSLPDDHLLETKPYAPHHSSAVFYGTLDFDPSSTSVAIPLDETSPTHYPCSNGMWNGLSYGDRGSFSCEESNGGGASSANMSLLKQGVPATESLHTCLETSASWYGKCTGILGTDNQIGSGITGQIDDECLAFPVGNPNATSSKILTSSVLCSTAIPQEVSELQEPYPALVVNSLGHDNKNTNSYERHTSQIYPYKPNPTVSHSLENNSFLAQVLKSSGDSMNFSELRPVSSVNLISSGNVTVNNNENSSGHTKSSSKRLDVLQNAKGKVVCRDESRIEEGEEMKDYIFVESSTNKDEFSIEKPVPDDVIDPLLVEKSKLRVTLPNLLDDFAYEADEDSPCWKGTLARHSPVEVLGPVNSQPLTNELEACKSLNPFAPQFFPGNGEGSLYYCGNDYCGGDLLAFPKSFSSDVKSLSEEHGLRDAAEAGPCFSKVSSGVEAQCSDRMHEPKKEGATLNSISTFEVNSSQMVKPSVVEDYFRSKGKFVIGANVSGSVNYIKDAAQNGSSCVPFVARDHASGVPPSGSSVPTETVETLSGALNSLLTPPIIDIQIVVNALHNLSELLIQNRSSDLDSLKEHDQEILKHVINNLYLCIRKRGGQRTLVSETAHPGTSYCPRKSTDFHEGTDMGFQVTRTKAVSVQRRPYNQNEHEKQISFPSVYSERVLDSFPPSSDAGIEKGDITSEFIETVLKENHQIEDDMHAQVLLYKNLWLQAEAALCSMKYKDCVVRLKTKMDKCKSDIKYG